MAQRDAHWHQLLDAKTQLIGQELFTLAEEKEPLLFQAEWWERQVIQWCMKGEQLRTQVLRFVDVYPSFKGPRQLVAHLKEYFPNTERRFPKALRLGIALASSSFFLTGRAIARETDLIMSRIAERFIAGASPQEALRVMESLEKENIGPILDLLGETTASEAEADAYLSHYLQLMDAVEARRKEKRLRSQTMPSISLKLSSLYSLFDPIDFRNSCEVVKGRLRRLLQKATNMGIMVTLDMEQYYYRDLTIKIFQELVEEGYENLGIVIQAYLLDSREVLEKLLSWSRLLKKPLKIRLTKGAYWDYEVINARQKNWPLPVFTQKWQTDANFEDLTLFLMENSPAVHLAIASHNIRSIAHAMALTEMLGLSKEVIDFEMLYGMADSVKKAIVKMGYPLKVYIPFGQLIPGMAYLVRRLLENTSNESFLRQNLLHELPERELLQNPRELAPQEAPSRSREVEAERDRFLNEPLADFSQEETRRQMHLALEKARGHLGKEYPLIIGKEKLFTTNRHHRPNPSAIKETIGQVSMADEGHAQKALEVAGEAFFSWSRLSVEKRVQYLRKAADVLAKRRYELAAWEVLETGKPWKEADADVTEAIDYLRYYSQEMLRLSEPRSLSTIPGETNLYRYLPRGVAVVISPWNFPLAILTGMTSAALVSGNTVVMKPSTQAAVVAHQLMEAFEEVGMPPGVVNYLPGPGGVVGEALVKSPLTAFVAFTGSKEVGLRLNTICSQQAPGQKHVKRLIAEMGGKNAVIVDETADLDEAVLGISESAFGYSGQKCSAASRVIVLEGVYETFLHRFLERARSLLIGPAQDPATIIGPLIDEQAYKKVLSYIDEGKKEGHLLFQADVGPLKEEGYFIGPTIFTDCSPTSTIAQEEIFGPVVVVLKARDYDEALNIANSTPFALTGGLFSRTPSHIERAKREFFVGNLYINRKITGAIVGRQPFGGFGLSGIGSKAGGPDYLLQFLLPQTVTENTMRHGFAPMGEKTEKA